MRARLVWGRLGKLIRREGVDPKVLEGFYTSVVQGDSIVWVRDVGPFGVNGKEDRGNAHVVPANDHGEDTKTIRRWDMRDAGRRRHSRGIGYPVG